MANETEFVGVGQGVDDQLAQGGAGDLGQMSERVQAMAQTLYEQLETLVAHYGVESAQVNIQFKVPSIQISRIRILRI